MNPEPKKWEAEFAGFCRTYLKRACITDEMKTIMVIGNLTEAIRPMLTQATEEGEEDGEGEDCSRLSCNGNTK